MQQKQLNFIKLFYCRKVITPTSRVVSMEIELDNGERIQRTERGRYDEPIKPLNIFCRCCCCFTRHEACTRGELQFVVSAMALLVSCESGRFSMSDAARNPTRFHLLDGSPLDIVCQFICILCQKKENVVLFRKKTSIKLLSSGFHFANWLMQKRRNASDMKLTECISDN